MYVSDHCMCAKRMHRENPVGRNTTVRSVGHSEAGSTSAAILVNPALLMSTEIVAAFTNASPST